MRNKTRKIGMQGELEVMVEFNVTTKSKLHATKMYQKQKQPKI